MEQLEKNIDTLETTLRSRRKEVENEKTEIERNERDVKDCRELSDASKLWLEASSRIALQRDQVHQKEADFRMMNSDREGRDLKQVEAELAESNKKKDDYNGTLIFFSHISSDRAFLILTFILCVKTMVLAFDGCYRKDH